MPKGGGEKTRFVADAMLGSLARKLRALGFDTAYFREGSDAAIVKVAVEEGRILLTADRALASRAARGELKAFLVGGSSDSSRLASLSRGAALSGTPLVAGESRCSVCNGRLESVVRSEVSSRVPPQVLKRHRLFFRCMECGQVYWRGGHWKKLRSLKRRLRQTSDDHHA